jgi:hypothetical protein
MLIGRFGNTSGAPYIEARIAIPRLRLNGLISFLVDTGADGTVLMPADSRKLSINFGSLKNPVTSEGIGGTAKGYNEQLILSFTDKKFIYSYLLNVEIASPTPHNHRFPSLLGRDIIDQWRFVMEKRAGKIVFTPRDWDLRQKI